jgi:hypothetical protein
MIEFFKDALAGVPAAAASPLALAAYCVAVLGFVLVSWRVNRNKNLLERLEALPEGDRFPALQAEMGGVHLATGISPEQWLKLRITRYYLLAFVVLVAAVVIVFAISALRATAPPEKKVAWSSVLPGELRFGLTPLSYAASLLGQPIEATTVYEHDRCRVSIIHTTDKGYNDVIVIPPLAILGFMIESKESGDECNVPIRAPFEFSKDGALIGVPNVPFSKATYDLYGTSAAVGTSDDPLKDPFHCEPFSRPMFTNGTGRVIGLGCIIHSKNSLSMRLWTYVDRLDASAFAASPAKALFEQWDEDNILLSLCAPRCPIGTTLKTQGYKGVMADEIIISLKKMPVHGVGFFPQLVRAINAEFCPGPSCASLAIERSGPEIPAIESLPQRSLRDKPKGAPREGQRAK